MIYGLSLIAYVQLLRSNLLLLALCVAGISALALLTGYCLTALHQGRKWSWYVQAIWSVGHTSLLVIGFLLALVAGALQTLITNVSEAASPLASYISLSHIVISLFWFQTKVKTWFGFTRAKT